MCLVKTIPGTRATSYRSSPETFYAQCEGCNYSGRVRRSRTEAMDDKAAHIETKRHKANVVEYLRAHEQIFPVDPFGSTP